MEGRRGKVVVAATGKGGAGKSTTIACLSAYWSGAGRSVALVDADPNLTLTRWRSKGNGLSRLPLRSGLDEHGLIPMVSELAAEHDLVMVDCAGFGNQSMIFAIGTADLVLIPVMTDEANIYEAVKTRKIVESASQLTGRKIQSRTLLCRVKRSAVAVHARTQLTSLQAEPLTSQLNDRVAFQEATFHGSSPTDLAPDGPAAREVEELAKELEAILW